MTESMKIAIIAINKWLFFGWNYGLSPYTMSDGTVKYIPYFLMQAKWTCNLDHMIGKWNRAIKCDNPDAYLTRFYAELDMSNRQALIEWVMDNFNDEQTIINQTL